MDQQEWGCMGSDPACMLEVYCQHGPDYMELTSMCMMAACSRAPCSSSALLGAPALAHCRSAICA